MKKGWTSMGFNREQQLAIYGEEPLIVTAAGAGSGKTSVLTERYVFLCEEKLKNQLGYISEMGIGAEVHSIVALTFTEDAALEMRGRIRQRLKEKWENVEDELPPQYYEEAKQFWKMQIENLEQAVISTFHSFCQKIVSEHPLELNVFPNMKAMDDIESKLMKTEIFSDIVEEAEEALKWQVLLNSDSPKALRENIFNIYGKLKEFEAEATVRDSLNIQRLLNQMDEQEKEKYVALKRFDDEFKTFFQSAPEYEDLTPANVLIFNAALVTFDSGKSLEDLYYSLEKGLSKIKNKVPVQIQKQHPEFYNLLTCWLNTRNRWNACPTDEDKMYFETLLREFESLVAEFDTKYEQQKREQALLDFSDLQQKAIGLLNDTEVQKYYGKKYKHFLLDEFQDTNQLQFKMLERIKPQYSFIVGDGKQSIYKFRGADVQLLNTMSKQAKKSANASFVDMNMNYRTCDSIIKFVNDLFEQEHLMRTELAEDAPLYKTEYSPLSANRNAETEKQPRVELITIPEEQDKTTDSNQYVMIARRMVELVKSKAEVFDKKKKVWRPVEWRDMAILMASRTDLAKIEKALNDLEVPFYVYGGLGFYKRQEIVDFITILQWLNRPSEDLYIYAMLRSPMFGLTIDDFLQIQKASGEHRNIALFIYNKEYVHLKDEQLKQKVESFYQLYIKWVPFHWSSAIKPILLQMFVDSRLKQVILLQKNNLAKLNNVEKLIDIITSLQAPTMDNMLRKLIFLAELSEKEGDADVELTGGNFVHIMTIHGSKGLEFPVVSVPNLSKRMNADKEMFRYDNEGGLYVKCKREDEFEVLAAPKEVKSANFDELSNVTKEQNIEEYKRLLYVALTRARDQLILSTKNKPERNTWYYWIDQALKTSESLNNYLTIKDAIPEQTPINTAEEMYEGPLKRVNRSVPISFSVSEVMSYLKDPDDFYEKYILKLNEQWLEDEEEISHLEEDIVVPANKVKATVLGTIVHKICELLDQGHSEHEAFRQAFSSFTEKVESEIYSQQVKPLVKAYLNHDLGTPVENEWKFSLHIDNVNIIGEIDKVVQSETGLQVIDLKTNKVSRNIDELLSYYKPQLYLYKLAYEQVQHESIENMFLLFLRDDEKGLYEVPFETEYADKIREAIKRMGKLKREYFEGKV